MKSFFLKAAVGLAGFAFLGCAAQIQPNYLKTNKAVLDKKYSAADVAFIKQQFAENPLQYSQQLGDMLLAQMYQKSPELALEFAQTPELNDGIDAKEATAMQKIWGLIEPLDIPADLFKEDKNLDIHRISLEWTGESTEKSDWGGYFRHFSRSFESHGRAINITPVGFEPEDSVLHEKLKKNGEIKWISKTNNQDKDGIIVEFQHYGKREIRANATQVIATGLSVQINNSLVCSIDISIEDLLSGKTLTYGSESKLKGILKVRNLNPAKYSKELMALRDMVLAGENDYRYSAPLQAILWGYMDSQFKPDENPLKTYKGVLEFVMPIWGEMEGPKWEDFDTVTSRLNRPELLDYYEQAKLRYEYYIGERKNSQQVIKTGTANCFDMSRFTANVLNKSGYMARLVWVDGFGPDGHILIIYQDNGKTYVMNNGNIYGAKTGIQGPFNSVREIPYKFNDFVR